MQNSVLTSTALLTALLAVGLAFFIRASTKDRIEVSQLLAEQQGEPLLERLQQYFVGRAYRLTAVDAAENKVIYEGMVRPSWFLAIFLSLLAAVGILCLALVLGMAFPGLARLLPALVLLAPLAGLFYWRKSARPEQVALQVEFLQGEASPRSLVTVTGHRDEVAELRQALGLKLLDAD
ncbi:MAG: cofactor assembly of complex C subunit B [Elainella sp.]